MQKKDWLIVALAPSLLLLLPIVGSMTVKGWNWHWNDFVFAWVVFALTTLVYRFIATRKVANLTYKLGAGLAVLAGFLIFWFTAAVQIIGDENPANILYLGVILIGLGGVWLSGFRPAGMANAALATAAATMLVPTIGFLVAPDDFSPGVPQVFMLNGIFAAMFVVSALLFRHAARQRSGSATVAAT